MQFFIIGTLLVIIIVVACWLVLFYNRMVNKKIKVDYCWGQLSIQIRKRDALMQKQAEHLGLENRTQAVDSVQMENQIKEIEDKISMSIQAHTRALLVYNKFLTAFPNNVAAMILGVKELPYSETDCM